MAGPPPQGPAPRSTTKSSTRKASRPRPPDAGSTPVTGASPVIHIADDVVAKIAAHYALIVPGVAALRVGLAGTVANLAGRVTRTSTTGSGELSSDGITVTVNDEERTAAITINTVMKLGMPLLEVAKHVQQQVGDNIEHATGLAAVVTVNIVDVTEEDADGEGTTDDEQAAGAP